MEVLLQNLLKRAKFLYEKQKTILHSLLPILIPFFEKRVTLKDYLALDDGVMNTYFQVWMTSPDTIYLTWHSVSSTAKSLNPLFFKRK